jgi:hypothetical protein
MTDPSASRRNTGFRLDQSVLRGSQVHQNVSQDYIVTTADKMRLHLMRYESNLKAMRDWTTPLAILISLMATLVVTNEFKDIFGINKTTWQSIFIISALVSSIWFIISASRAVNAICRKQAKIENIVQAFINEYKTTTF